MEQISQVLDRYTRELQERRTSFRNLQRHNSTVKVLIENMGDVRFDALDWSVTRNYIRNRRAKPQTAARELHVLRAALHFCRKVGEIEWTPFIFDDAKPPARERWLTLNEIGRLLDACEDDFVKLWTRIALSTAARAEAILSLTTDRVHFEENIIDFRDPTIMGKHKPRSVIKMPSSLRPHLEEASRNSQSGYIVERNGKRVREIYSHFKKVAVSAGLDDVTPHIMRHTCAVHMVKNGVPIYEVSRYLGHKTVAITQSNYAKFAPDFMEKSSEVGSSLIA